jgi:cation-transporting P-type ATPase 13A2
LSSCFAPSTAEEAEDDPVLEEIRYLDYRYIRFVFHPIRGKFQLMSNWRDPSWRNLKDVLDGLEGDTHDARARLFGENVIDIEEKPIFKLLTDEARPEADVGLIVGVTSILHFPSIFNYFMVDG